MVFLFSEKPIGALPLESEEPLNQNSIRLKDKLYQIVSFNILNPVENCEVEVLSPIDICTGQHS